MSIYNDLSGLDSWDLLRHPPSDVSIDMVLGTTGARWGVPRVVTRLKEVLEAQTTRHSECAAPLPASPVPLPPQLDPNALSGKPVDHGTAVQRLRDAPVDAFALPGGSCRLHSIAAGHWLHAEKPMEVAELLAGVIRSEIARMDEGS